VPKSTTRVVYSEQTSPTGLDHSAALMRGTCKCIGDNALYGTLLKTQEIKGVRTVVGGVQYVTYR
jgi:hypothetical protein